mgnify:FL=1
MNLLFNPSGFGINFKELLGFVSADIEFILIKPDIINATKEIIRLIGKDTYDIIHTAYDAENKDDLVHACRYAIAVNAVRLYAPSGDLSHTSNGRVMRSTENEKSAFEWMLDRDDKNLEIKYYRAIDNLLELLQEESTFTSSDNYKKLTELIITKTDDFDDFYPIESRLLLLKLIPGIRLAEIQKLRPIMSQSDFEQAHTDISQLDDDLQINIKGALINAALAWSMTRLSINLMPEGVKQKITDTDSTTKGKKTPELLEHNLAAQNFNKDADFYLSLISSYYADQSTDDTYEDLPDSLRPNFNSDSKSLNT